MKRRTVSAILIVSVLLSVSCSEQQGTSELIQPADWWEKLPRPVYASLEQVGIFQDWFEVYKLSEGTYAIYEPYQFEEAISYLVLGSERGVIIDTGTGIGDIKAVVEELTDLPVSVLNTHEHFDHVGGNHRFDEIAIFGNADAINVLIEGIDNESLQRHIREESLWKPLPKDFDPATWVFPSVEPTFLIDEGTLIDLGGRVLETIYTPGHSPGSACFLDIENRLLFTGDHFFPGPLYAYPADVNIDDYIASIKKIAARIDEYDYVLAGHNDPWVKSEVIPRVDKAFETVMSGGGEYSEDGDIRRYKFEGFDILIRTDMIK
ncbi:MBL fold metallo-hydrolase [candidate division KSB1 bacterium]